MIYSGFKKEEYRAITPYWCAHLLRVNGNRMSRTWWETKLIDPIELLHDINNGTYQFANFDRIIFSNGYAKNRDKYEIEFKSIKISTGRQEWGAMSDILYFTISLGNITKKM